MNKDINYALGLDIGITSVGWAVINLDLNRIEDLGVRIFNAAENPKDGSSLALPRRLARGRRRLLRRKVYRVERVRKLILRNNILTKEELEGLFKNKEVIDVWEARVKGLDYKLSREEWAKILINFCKRRGFKSNRKNETKDKEAGQILSSISYNIEKMKETNSRTIGEYIYNEVKNSDDSYAPLRNKFGEYKMCVSRDVIREEIHTLFEKQRELGNNFASDEIEDKYFEIFNSQRPFSNFEDLEKLVGFCTFERKKHKRAPKHCISSEEFTLYEGINKLSIIKDGEKRKLSEEERTLVVNEAFNKKEIKYTTLRKLLGLSEEELFSTLTYSIDKDISKTENTKFVSLKGYHEIKRAIEKGVSKKAWQDIENNRNLLNDIAYVLTLGKTDDEIEKQLRLRNVPEELFESLLDMSFNKFNNLSIYALEKILPFMKEGYQYNEACEKAGYNLKAIYEGVRTKKLPVIEIDEIVNPVVNRALAQTRKVINSIIDKYGSPVRINIELARDLAKNFKDRKLIEKEQKENRANLDKIRENLRELMDKEPTAVEVLKYRLWEQQRGECAYTQSQIPLERLFSPGYCEIDHIIPFSRSFDDSLSNKILVLGSENQRKGNKIPYEYFGEDSERWNSFEITVNGRATAYLRSRWGLNKVREDGDKHHALDAAVVGVTTQGMVQKISKYSKAHELYTFRKNDEFVDVETGECVDVDEYKEIRKDILPRPWRGFSEELKLRLSDNPLEELKKSPIKTYNEEFIKENVKPIFVSRVPFRKISGKLFKETIYSERAFKDGYFVSKKSLVDLKKGDLDNFYNYECDKKLYDAISERMKEFNYNGKKAFESPFRKPTKSGKEGPVVRSVKIKSAVPFKDGIPMNEGLVAKEGMVRIDIYEKEGKYFVVPVYRYQLAKGIVPKRAAIAGKSEFKWPIMDQTYNFKFSIFKNDLIEIKYAKKDGYFGYYDGFDRHTASLVIENHDNSDRYRGIGVKAGVVEFNKYEVDVLGNYHKVKLGGN